MTDRKAVIARNTNETKINISINLDDNQEAAIDTRVGFFDHMLEQIVKHAFIGANISCEGDIEIDDHHSVEDTGIALGLALKEALGDKAGIHRYGHFSLVMDETWVDCALDLSGRGFLVFDVEFSSEKIGDFDTELVREFFQALAMNAGMTLHLSLRYGENSHHIAEACFKAFARALRMAIANDLALDGKVMSTKGVL